MSKDIKKKFEQLYNKYLCDLYPFLNPHIGKWKKWNYEFIELDNMPDGWRKSFGLKMCEEIKKALIKNNCLNNYYIAEIKEKYGGLRWYDYGAPVEVEKIIKKYEQLSYYTCINCGQSATKISRGWISPFCDKCAEKSDGHMKFENIEKIYYNK